MFYFNTNKPQSFLFFCRILLVLESRIHGGGGGGAPREPPTVPPPLNPDLSLMTFFFLNTLNAREK